MPTYPSIPLPLSLEAILDCCLCLSAPIQPVNKAVLSTPKPLCFYSSPLPPPKSKPGLCPHWTTETASQMDRPAPSCSPPRSQNEPYKPLMRSHRLLRALTTCGMKSASHEAVYARASTPILPPTYSLRPTMLTASSFCKYFLFFL